MNVNVSLRNSKSMADAQRSRRNGCFVAEIQQDAKRENKRERASESECARSCSLLPHSFLFDKFNKQFLSNL